MRIKPKYVPDNCNYLTAGKEYDVILGDRLLATITDDYGNPIMVCPLGSAHTEYRPWEVIKQLKQLSGRSDLGE